MSELADMAKRAGLGQDRLDQARLGVLETRECGDLRHPGQMIEYEPHVVRGRAA